MCESERQPTCDWTECDISRISDTDFPIHCDRCGYRLALGTPHPASRGISRSDMRASPAAASQGLAGLGDGGRCPECGMEFQRRARLWAIHGPEAFADPPGDDDEPPTGDRGFAAAVFTAIACAASLPLVILGGRALSESADLSLCLVAWLIIVSCVEWILAARDHPRQEEQDENGSEGG